MLIPNASSCHTRQATVAIKPMSSALEAFLSHVESHPELEERLATCDINGILELAMQAGFEFRAADLLKAQAKQILEMNDDDLDVLAQGGLEDLMSIKEFQSYLNRI